MYSSSPGCPMIVLLHYLRNEPHPQTRPSKPFLPLTSSPTETRLTPSSVFASLTTILLAVRSISLTSSSGRFSCRRFGSSKPWKMNASGDDFHICALSPVGLVSITIAAKKRTVPNTLRDLEVSILFWRVVLESIGDFEGAMLLKHVLRLDKLHEFGEKESERLLTGQPEAPTNPIALRGKCRHATRYPPLECFGCSGRFGEQTLSWYQRYCGKCCSHGRN